MGNDGAREKHPGTPTSLSLSLSFFFFPNEAISILVLS